MTLLWSSTKSLASTACAISATFYTAEDNFGKTPQHHNIKEGVVVKAPPSSLHHLPDRSNEGVLGVEPGTREGGYLEVPGQDAVIL